MGTVATVRFDDLVQVLAASFGKRKTGLLLTWISQEGGIIIDRAKHLATIDGNDLDLTLSEFKLLSFLMDKKGWVFTRKQIVDAIRGESYSVTERSVDVVIVGLRKKLKNHASELETVRGVGYRFKE